MTHVLLLNLVFFFPAVCGAAAFAFFVYRFLRSTAPPTHRAGPDDLARSA